MVKSLLGSSAPPLRLTNRRWTYDDIREMPETLEHTEIIDGDLCISPSPNVLRHQRIATRLARWIGNWVERQGLGEVFAAPADVVLAEDKVVQPDVFYIRSDKLHTVGAHVASAPEFVVEVVSPSSAVYDRKTKFGLYEQTGVREYWIVDPEDQSVEVYALRNDRYELLGSHGRGDEVKSDVLSGLRVQVDAIFE